jgi:hypothetical protein
MELAPCTTAYITQTVAGCQGFIGPFPSAFLDKLIKKNSGKGKVENQLSTKIFSPAPVKPLPGKSFPQMLKVLVKNLLICIKLAQCRPI